MCVTIHIGHQGYLEEGVLDVDCIGDAMPWQCAIRLLQCPGLVPLWLSLGMGCGWCYHRCDWLVSIWFIVQIYNRDDYNSSGVWEIIVYLGLMQPLCCIFPQHIDAAKNGHHFPDNIFKHIFLSEDHCIVMTPLMTFVPQGPIINILALV